MVSCEEAGWWAFTKGGVAWVAGKRGVAGGGSLLRILQKKKVRGIERPLVQLVAGGMAGGGLLRIIQKRKVCGIECLAALAGGRRPFPLACFAHLPNKHNAHAGAVGRTRGAGSSSSCPKTTITRSHAGQYICALPLQAQFRLARPAQQIAHKSQRSSASWPKKGLRVGFRPERSITMTQRLCDTL